MNKWNAKLIKEKAESSPLWVLEMRVSKQNMRLLELAGHKTNSDDCNWRNLITKRNIYRSVLFEKLKKWKKGSEESNPTYSDYLATLEYKKQRQEQPI